MLFFSKKRKNNLASPDRFSTSNDAHLSALSSIGLSQYESKCFLASLQAGPSTINQIGIIAGVPRTKVYGAVKKLVERGLLEQNEENPKIFIAKPPKDVLIPLLENESKRINQGLAALTELQVIHQSMEYVKKAESLRSKVLRYYPRQAVTRKQRELFESSHHKVVVLTTANGFIRLSRMSDLLFERSKHGVKVDVFSAIRDETVFATAVQSMREIENCNISLLPSTIPIQIVVVDSEYLLVSEIKPDDLRDDGQDVAFLIQNSELADMMESLIRIVEPLQRADPLKKLD